MAEVARDRDMAREASSRQRRRKKRMSRELEDHTNESLESPSSVPERIPLQEVVDGEKVGVPHCSASNNSGDQEGSSGVHQSTAERRNRARRPRRRSRMENGKEINKKYLQRSVKYLVNGPFHI